MKKINYIWIPVMAGMLALWQCSSPAVNTDRVELETRMDTVSYIIGLDYGTGIRDENIDVNRLAVYRGIADGLSGTSLLPDSVKEAIIDEFNEVLKQRIEEEGKKFLEQNKLEGMKFLEEILKGTRRIQVMAVPGGILGHEVDLFNAPFNHLSCLDEQRIHSSAPKLTPQGRDNTV